MSHDTQRHVPLRSISRAIAFTLSTLLLLLFIIPGYSGGTAQAGFNPIKVVTDAVDRGSNWVGKRVGSFLGGATEPVVSNVEDAGRRLIEDADSRFGKRIEQVDKVLAQKMAEADTRLEKRIVQVDDVMKKRIDQVDQVLDTRIQQVNEVAQSNIKLIDKSLAERVDQVDGVLARRIDQVDGVLQKNIDRMDIVTETRVGNLDIVATKATLAIESSAARLLLLACMLIFVAIAAWWAYSVGLEQWRKEEESGGNRTQQLGRWLKSLWFSLLIRVGGAALCLAIMNAVFHGLSGAPARELQSLVTSHEGAYDTSIKLLDIRKAKYHAEQLQLLSPSNSLYRAMAVKAGVLQDTLARPEFRSSVVGLRSVEERLLAIEELNRQSGHTDLDTNVVRAFLIWQVGSTRTHEYQAAVLCADSLKRYIEAQGKDKEEPDLRVHLTLSQLAGNYLENYLFMQPPDDVVKSELNSAVKDLPPAFAGSSIKPGELPTNSELEVLLSLAKKSKIQDKLGLMPLAEHKNVGEKDKVTTIYSAMSHLSEYNYLTRRVVSDVAYQYPKMVEANLKYTRIKPEWANDKKKHRVTFEEQSEWLKKRSDAAGVIVKAWKDFDRALDDSPLLAGTTAPVTALTLNDASYTRARWFVDGQFIATGTKWTPITDPQAGNMQYPGVPPSLEQAFPVPKKPNPDAKADETYALTTSQLSAKRVWLAPPRIFWSRRYLDDLSIPSRHLANMEAAQVFTTGERELIDFEVKYASYLDKFMDTSSLPGDIEHAAAELMKVSYDLGLLSTVESKATVESGKRTLITIPFAEYIENELAVVSTVDKRKEIMIKLKADIKSASISRRIRFL